MSVDVRRSFRQPIALGPISLCLLSVVLAAPPSLARTQGPRTGFETSHQARALNPGEIVLLDVRPTVPPSDVRATAFGQAIRFFPVESEGVWRALIGIDLTTEPGDYPVAVRLTTAGDETVRQTHTLTVESKDFPTRRLTVNPSYVNPPADVVGRIQRETRLQAELFATATGERLWRGGFQAPVPGEATSSFGRRSVFNGQPRSPHSGADFQAAEGTPIRAPNHGIVALAGELYFSGNVVILDHGWGLYSYFAHLSAIDVADGDVVTPGQIVGKVGATGRVTGPHLHWTVRLNDARVDPIALMELFPAPG
jgi:murein DD-endopeptidase MepM/ murein hydrolase activator NlpD